MTKVKLNQNTRMACSRIFPSSLETRAGGLPFPAAVAAVDFVGRGGQLERSRAGTRAARPRGAAPSGATPTTAAPRRDFRQLQSSLNVFSVILSRYNTITHRI